ncbi:hypothetical protein ZWY2020_022909 [Hordeum vulgare]|nr:hypothetical protein ZWY2020_022909 [Hordeum vulgare]
MEQDDAPVYAQQVFGVDCSRPATPPISINCSSHGTLYLDHIAQPNEDVNCETSPRISAFDDDHVNRIIMSDMISKHNLGFPFPQFGKLQLRKPPTIYSSTPEEGSQEKHHSTPSTNINQPCMSNISEFLQTRFKSTKLRSIYGEEASSSTKDGISSAQGEFSSILQDISDFENFIDNPLAIQASEKLNKIMCTTVFNSIKIAVRATLRNVLSDNQNTPRSIDSHRAPHSNPPSGLTPTSFRDHTVLPCQHTSMPERDQPQTASEVNIGSGSTTSNTYKNLAYNTPPSTRNASASPSKQKSSISPASAARLAQEWTVALATPDSECIHGKTNPSKLLSDQSSEVDQGEDPRLVAVRVVKPSTPAASSSDGSSRRLHTRHRSRPPPKRGTPR